MKKWLRYLCNDDYFNPWWRVVLQFAAIYATYLFIGITIGIIGYFVTSAIGVNAELYLALCGIVFIYFVWRSEKKRKTNRQIK